VLVSLDDRQAAELMAKMNPRQVEAITAAIENLHEIDPAEQADALREFYGRMGMDRPGSTDRVPPQVETLPALSDDLRDWPADAIRFAFDPASVDDWSLALADTDQEQIRRVLKALSLRDRKLVAESDRRRGPWRLHEPHDARQRIRSRFVESAGL
jgi:flagellar motor switch protein FliG